MIRERTRTVPTMLSRMNISVAQTDGRLLHIYVQNMDECTTDQELTDAAVYVPADASFSLTRWQHFVA